MAPPAQESGAQGRPGAHSLCFMLPFCPLPLPHPSFPVECRDTTRYCEKVKQLKLCQLSQFKSRCCGTCGKA